MVKVGDAFVPAIDGHGVLHEVVGADAEEFDFAGELVGDERGGGDFDHGADFDVSAVGNALRRELVFAFLQDGIGGTEFVDLRHHGIHDADVAMNGGAEDGAELGFENFRLREAEPDGAATEEGIVFRRLVGDVHEFVAADVQGADDDAVGRAFFGDFAVGLILLVLAGRAGTMEEEKLGAEKADALGAGGDDGVKL